MNTTTTCKEKAMKNLARAVSIITITATLGACAGQTAYTNEREYRNPYLRAKHIAAPAESCNGGESQCLVQQQPEE
jgi:hypothetical protein